MARSTERRRRRRSSARCASARRGRCARAGSGKKVTSRKQAIAIGLSEARKAGAKVPKRRRAPDGLSEPQRRRVESGGAAGSDAAGTLTPTIRSPLDRIARRVGRSGDADGRAGTGFERAGVDASRGGEDDDRAGPRRDPSPFRNHARSHCEFRALRGSISPLPTDRASLPSTRSCGSPRRVPTCPERTDEPASRRRGRR